ncbi:MAG: AIR synthase-related protein, partial [Halobacteriaceae archaeon]
WNLPPDDDLETVQKVMSIFDREARDIGTSVVTGHTGQYAGCSWPTVGAGTALAVREHDEIVRPTGASIGDDLIITKGPAIETVAILAIRFPEKLDLNPEMIDLAQQRFDEVSPVKDAVIAGSVGASAMHDATERGIANALIELADASNVGLEIERDEIPVGPGVHEVCDALGIDPMSASSSGSVLITAPNANPIVDALSAEGIRASRVGSVVEGGRVHVDGAPL